MDPGRVRLIRLPPWYRGVRPNHEGAARKFCLLAFDTETVRGYPYTLQLTADGREAQLLYLAPRQFLPRLIAFARDHVQRVGGSAQVVLMGFNLAYDLPAILYPHAHRFKEGHFTVQLPKLGASIEVFYGRIPFAKIRFPDLHRGTVRVVWIVDAFAFTWTSLSRSAQLYGLPTRKLPRPKGLGSRVLRSRAFRAYAIGDVLTTWQLGQRILRWHREFDLRLCVSIAQFSGRIFQHEFLRRTIRRPPQEVLLAALLSYHGGKNGFYLDRPRWLPGVREYDVKSAYPWAMAQLPSVGRGRWVPVGYVHPHLEGFYRISGRVIPDRYPIVFDHAFRPARGYVRDLWITSYELREAVRSGEVQTEQLSGWVWEPASRDRPLRAFVRKFYRLKERAQSPEEQEVYKLILNSLYGKFIQLNENDDGTERPGALFHPVLASWITGLVRARMHQLEHEAQALHTATDAIHTTAHLPTSRGLGGLELKQDGPALLLRNKVYLHFDRAGRSCKYALHGIHVSGGKYREGEPVRGTDLEKFWTALLRGKARYRITHLLRPKEALARGDRPLRPVYKTYRVTLRLPAEDVPDAARRFFHLRTAPTALAIRARQDALVRAAVRQVRINRRTGQLRRMEREFLEGYEAFLEQELELAAMREALRK